MMPIINFTNIGTILITLVLYILVTLLGKQMKKSIIPAILLGVFLLIIVGHAFEFAIIGSTNADALQDLPICLALDFVFIFLSFMSYLWVDDIEAKYKEKKVLNSSGIDWFWSKV